MIYMSKFFQSLQDAKEFQKQKGRGVLYKNTPKSKTKNSYMVEAAMCGKSEDFIADHPFVVAWNES